MLTAVAILAGIPALVRTLDGRFFGDRLSKLAASALCAAILFALLMCLVVADAAVLRELPASFHLNDDGIFPAAILCLLYGIALYALWLGAAKLKQLRRTG